MKFTPLLAAAAASTILFPAMAESACKTYTLSSSKKSITVTSSMITNKGPGEITVYPPGLPMAPNDLFIGNPNSRSKVVLTRGTKAHFEACT